MDKFNHYLYLNYGIQMTEGLTISRLALNIYMKDYLNEHKIASITQSYHYNFIKSGYYGGITEVYKPYGKDLKYYDVNSLYPHAALNPMPGTNVQYIESKGDTSLNLDDLFGFFFCTVKTNNGYLGLLPMKYGFGIINPNGEYSGI